MLGYPESGSEVQKTRKEIPHQDLVKKIFSFQNEKGYWGDPKRLWGYQNTAFQLVLLSELGMERDTRIEKAVEIISEFQLEDGSFTSDMTKKTKKPKEFCLTGIVLRFLLLFGYDDSRVRDALTFLVTAEENGWSCPWYPLEKGKVIPQKCYMGGIKVLGAFCKLHPHLVTGEVEDIIQRTAETCLQNRIHWYRKDRNGKRAKKLSWTRFTFPFFWQSDALDALDVLTELHVKDERMEDALNLVKSKQVEGTWVLERTYMGKALVELEEVGKPSKWITLRALRILKRIG